VIGSKSSKKGGILNRKLSDQHKKNIEEKKYKFNLTESENEEEFNKPENTPYSRVRTRQSNSSPQKSMRNDRTP
jgi:hypothetical protein